MIVGLFPELSSAGGVQRAGQLIAGVLFEFAAKRKEGLTLLCLNDPADAPALRIGSQQITFKGFGRSKSRFAWSAMSAAVAQPKLIIALHPHLAPIVVAMKFCAPRSHTVLVTHGIEVWSPLGLTRRWALQRSEIVVAPSSETQRQLEAQQGVAVSKTRKLRWSLGPEFDPNTLPCISRALPQGFPRGRVILSVGRWDAREAYKGLDHLIMVLPELVSAVPELHLVAIGDGTDLPRLERLAEQLGVAERVHFLRQVRTEELSAAYDACEIFALPSRGEGFGLVFLEAMSHGKPVIGGAHGGTPEIVADGMTGYLVQHGDVARLTERLLHLLSNESCRRQMGARAFERVCSDFMYDRFSTEFTDLLESTLVS